MVKQWSRTVSPSGSMAVGLWLEAACERRAWRMTELDAHGSPSTGRVIVALCSYAIALHGSPFDCSVTPLSLD